MSFFQGVALWTGYLFWGFVALMGIAFPLGEAVHHLRKAWAVRRGRALDTGPLNLLPPLDRPHLYDQAVERRFEVVR